MFSTETARLRALAVLEGSKTVRDEMAKADAATIAERRKLIAALASKRKAYEAFLNDAGFDRLVAIDAQVKQLEANIDALVDQRSQIVIERSRRTDELRGEITSLRAQVGATLPLAVAEVREQIDAAFGQHAGDPRMLERVALLFGRIAPYINGDVVEIDNAVLTEVRAELQNLPALQTAEVREIQKPQDYKVYEPRNMRLIVAGQSS